MKTVFFLNKSIIQLAIWIKIIFGANVEFKFKLFLIQKKFKFDMD